jgi:DNA-binding CsgD family transcriptional regulator
MLGLTLGEARIAAHIGSGLAPRETAARLGITEGATRTTLKRVFSKLGVSRQSELAVLLTRLVPR